MVAQYSLTTHIENSLHDKSRSEIVTPFKVHKLGNSPNNYVCASEVPKQEKFQQKEVSPP